jgi:hypothetical protein
VAKGNAAVGGRKIWVELDCAVEQAQCLVVRVPVGKLKKLG